MCRFASAPYNPQLNALFLTQPAPAKLNLGLHVLRRGSDGYHDIETIFLKIGWVDEISVSAGNDITISCDDPGLTAEDLVPGEADGWPDAVV